MIYSLECLFLMHADRGDVWQKMKLDIIRGEIDDTLIFQHQNVSLGTSRSIPTRQLLTMIREKDTERRCGQFAAY